ncbi:MAG: radical SAM protein [Myxococcota bacterium]
MSSGRRLLVRLTTQCNSRCAHCTIADIAHHPEPAAEAVWEEIVRGRHDGCTELVFMRGEATLRKELLSLSRRARRIGYEHIQLQTNARMLAYEAYLDRLLGAGVNFFEVSFFGDCEGLHDLIDGCPGAFEQASAGLRFLAQRGVGTLVTVPVVARNYTRLAAVVETLHGLGVRRVQLNWTRPVRVGPRWVGEPLVRLSAATPYVREALARARALGMVGETEAVPLCHLDPQDRAGADVMEDFARHQVADVHRRERSLADHRRAARPLAAVCEPCSLKGVCPTTWAAYQQLFGTWEFRPVLASGDAS